MIKYILTNYQDIYKIVSKVVESQNFNGQFLQAEQITKVDIEPGLSVMLNEESIEMSKKFYSKKLEKERIIALH